MNLEHLALRLRHPGEGLVHLDPAGVVLDADHGARRLLGLAADRGASFLAVVHPADLAAAGTLLLGGAGTTKPLDLRVRGADDDTWRWLEAVSSATPDGVVILFLDVSDRRRRLLELERITDEIRRLAPPVPGSEGLAPGAGRDAVTGLLDRTAGFDVLTDRSCAGQATAVLLLDVDGFSDFCAEHGHGAGDVALRLLARRIVAAVTPGDVVVRTGADELAVITDDPGSRGQLAAYGERLAIVAAAPVTVHGHPVRLTASVGGASGGSDVDPDTLLSCALDALRRARALGGGRSVAVDVTPSSAD